MPLGTFTILTLIGSLIWNSLLVTAGYLLGEQWDRVLDFTEPFQDLVMVLIAGLVIAVVVRKVVMVRRERAAEEQAHPGMTHESLEEVIEDLEQQAEHDPALRSKLHDD